MRLIDADALMRKFKTASPMVIDGRARQMVEEMLTVVPERKRGRWLDKKVVRPTNYGCIAEWQSCKCSECGRYDTRPYMYYFDEPNFCSWCGAEMREDEA